MKISFTSAAADLLVNEALAAAQPVRDLCAKRFKDFQFGLKLIAQNSGQQEFVLDTDAVQFPDKVLSDWVMASYRPGQGKEGEGREPTQPGDAAGRK